MQAGKKLIDILTPNWPRIVRGAGLVALAALALANFLADAAKVDQVAHLGLVSAVNTIGFDWTVLAHASHVAVAGGNPYQDIAFLWTPVGAFAFFPVSLVGWHLWQIAHLGAALAMPGWRLRAIVLLAYPFWWDMELGNILVFVLLAAAWALRGNQLAIGAFLVLTALVPRPLMAPIALWLLWRHAGWRLPFAAMVIGVVIASGAMDLLGPFISRALEVGKAIRDSDNLAPSRLIGPFWVVVAIPLAAWLTLKSRLGLASVLASPYWLPYYLLIGLVDLDPRPQPPVHFEPAQPRLVS
jgi:hypothetical protein